MTYVVLDTDVASAVLRRRLPDLMRARLAGRSLAVTFVTVGELTAWTVLRNWGPRRLRDMSAWRRHVVTLPFDEVASRKRGAMLQARAQRRGRPRPVNDMWIAACCLVDRLPLATFNVKDFEDFAEYEDLELIRA